jgi:ABC-type amino acid transport substrate-binding protein
MDWSSAQEAMKNGKYDVIDTAFYNEQRDTWLDFSKPYVTINVPVYHDNRIGGITDVKSLRGFLVAVKKGDACIEVLKKAGVSELVEYSSYEAIIDAVRGGKVRVFVMDEPPALYYLYKTGLASRYSGGETIYAGAFHRAVAEEIRKRCNWWKTGFRELRIRNIKPFRRNGSAERAPTCNLSYFLKYFLAALAVVAFTIF